MATLTDFVVALIQSTLELVVNFATVATSDIVSPVIILVGNLFIIAAVGALIYVVLGALVAELGIGTTPGQRGTPRPRE
ncbi:hypothetical protein C440_05233 [Haloferax mucosum ATCC BAA-1512]|uniref:Uncharacterized protein n=1 Tax=Haloferax mucosum ATCC BAA-1512 TaxID=662479 RepID=M0IM59_9EURY|nr:hypothetical protein [Haloferax mucosum]ELZ96524.1 hypothetical protein C440_05233 [Haloferax mucosum ATCC BAA-1512]